MKGKISKVYFTLAVVFAFGLSASSQTEPKLVLPIGHTGGVFGLSSSPNEELIASYDSENHIFIWDSDGNKISEYFSESEITFLQFVNDEEIIVTSIDQVIRINIFSSLKYEIAHSLSRCVQLQIYKKLAYYLGNDGILFCFSTDTIESNGFEILNRDVQWFEIEGEFVYLLTKSNQLLCFDSSSGEIKTLYTVKENYKFRFFVKAKKTNKYFLCSAENEILSLDLNSNSIASIYKDLYGITDVIYNEADSSLVFSSKGYYCEKIFLSDSSFSRKTQYFSDYMTQVIPVKDKYWSTSYDGYLYSISRDFDSSERIGISLFKTTYFSVLNKNEVVLGNSDGTCHLVNCDSGGFRNVKSINDGFSEKDLFSGISKVQYSLDEAYLYVSDYDGNFYKIKKSNLEIIYRVKFNSEVRNFELDKLDLGCLVSTVDSIYYLDEFFHVVTKINAFDPWYINKSEKYYTVNGAGGFHLFNIQTKELIFVDFANTKLEGKIVVESYVLDDNIFLFTTNDGDVFKYFDSNFELVFSLQGDFTISSLFYLSNSNYVVIVGTNNCLYKVDISTSEYLVKNNICFDSPPESTWEVISAANGNYFVGSGYKIYSLSSDFEMIREIKEYETEFVCTADSRKSFDIKDSVIYSLLLSGCINVTFSNSQNDLNSISNKYYMNMVSEDLNVPLGSFLLNNESYPFKIIVENQPKLFYYKLSQSDWLVYDEDYRFDGSPGAIEKLYFTCGLEIIELGQMKDALYVPGLAEKIVNGEDINYPKLSEIDICGALPIIEKTEENDGGWKFQLEQRRWPVVRIDVKVDGKTVKSIPSNQLQFENGIVEISLGLSEMQHFFVGGKENVISISAVTSQNGSEIKSRGIDVLFFAEEPKDPPRMFMLMIGVSDYKDDALDLVFPAHDARSLGNALELSANKLLGKGKVTMYHVQSKTKENKVFTTPEREGVMKALADIGSKAKANDVLFIFFAGHGVMQGQSDKSFTFLTADASQMNQIGISTTDLISWLSPEGPFKMLPNKTILVYDACNSGQAAKELIAALARNDDDTERLRQIEELGDKSGLFILSASAPNKPAYELPQLGQGLLTYSLLYTLKNNPNIIDQGQDGKGYLNLQKWFLESEREQNQRVLSLGLKQEAQPYGTGNIKLGVVDDEVRNSIQLMDEKPLVFCGNARDENDEDPLELKRSVNDYYENALVRGLSSSLAFVAAETPNANVIKLIYNIEENQVSCRVLFFKNKIKLKEITVNASSENILPKIVETITSALEN